jgi:uncharacterized repeat protein (TIGR03803 family)
MTHSEQCPNLIFRIGRWTPATALASATVFALTMAAAPAARAQTYSVIYNFTGGSDGASPYAGLAMDRGGNLYGTTSARGPADDGTVFKLAPKGSDWILTPLYGFLGGTDGAFPIAPVSIGPDGNLYGITYYGGNSGCGVLRSCGTVFKLTPPATACKAVLCPWIENVLYRFTGGNDGGNPTGDLMFDSAGNIYGTTWDGGTNNQGTVFKLARSGSNWTESVLYSFNEPTDGRSPQSGVIADAAGNLLGTAMWGGPDSYGTVFELTHSGSAWTETVLRNLQLGNDGAIPVGGLIFDPAGNLYGTTSWAGPNSGGTVFELSPSNGTWTFAMLYGLTCYGDWCGDGISSGPGPQASLLMDAAGSLYGTTDSDGPYGCGSVFKLTPSGGAWTYSSLHDFTGGTDGCHSAGSVIMDTKGNLYGTASVGGTSRNCINPCGVVWQITP